MVESMEDDLDRVHRMAIQLLFMSDSIETDSAADIAMAFFIAGAILVMKTHGTHHDGTRDRVRDSGAAIEIGLKSLRFAGEQMTRICEETNPERS